MSASTLALPVSVEQIAAVIKQMNREDQRRLLRLGPALSQIVREPPARTIEQTQENIEQLRVQVLAALGNQPLSPDEPFFGGLTVGQYLSLSDQEQAALWDEWAGIDLMDIEEIEVSPDAVFAR